MQSQDLKLVTIITEALLEQELVRDLNRLGVPGYTIVDARGRGHRGVRESGWEHGSNIRVEIVCDTLLADKICAHMKDTYYENYAMIIFMTEVQALRPGKFRGTDA